MQRCLALFLLVIAPIFAGAEKKPTVVTNAHAGVTTRVFHPTAPRNWRQAQHQELHVTIWYPAMVSAVETRQVIGPPDAPLFEAGMASPRGEMEPALRKLPLIVLSHGTGGTAMQLAWLGTVLARAGYIVAAVDHPGNNGTEPYTEEGFVLWWERATDLSEVIDGMLADEDFGPQIDRDRIGAAGFSIGGYTVLELAGARTDISVLYDHCRTDPTYVVCGHVPEMKNMGTPEQMLAKTRKTSGLSLAASGDSYRDPRVKAVFAIAPAVAEVFTAESLRAIRLPVAIAVGDSDPIAPAKENADYVRANIKGAREQVLPGGVGHYTFLDTCTALGKEKVGVYCEDKPGVDRDKVHADVAGGAVQFFDWALKVK